MNEDMIYEIKKAMNIAYMSRSTKCLSAARETMETMLATYPVNDEIRKAVYDYYEYMKL